MGTTTAKGKTPWFSGDVKPVRNGVYERKGMNAIMWSKWDGESWCISSSTHGVATLHENRSNYQTLQWRGLAAKP